MLPSHRKVHARLWVLLALLLPLILFAGALVQPAPQERPPQKLDQAPDIKR